MRIEHAAIWTAGVERQATGLRHLAFALGSEAAVEGPRRTGDGYYEAAVLDGDGNRVELTV